MMWQEARKQERKIRGLLVDYKKRAERRKDYYEKIKADPTQFIQLHGRPCKIHLDPAVAIAADSPVNMMPWQGNQDILIDRFDVRAHLDYIPEVKSSSSEEELSYDERHINYERYRILVQNDFLGVSEEKFLQQLTVEEQFGPVEKSEPQPIEGKKKIPGAAIGYNYDEGSSGSTNVLSESNTNASNDGEGDDNEEEEDSDIDFDLCVDVNKIGSQQAHEMNACAHVYGMHSNDFFSFLTRDVEEAENLKIAREREEEKAMFSGRKSRRERRAYREKKLIGRKLSPPSYASRGPEQEYPRSVSKSASKSRSRSRSYSPVNTGQITYITSFGGDEPPPPAQVLKASGNNDENSYKRVVRYRSRSPSQSSKRRIVYHQGSRSDTFPRGQHSRSRGSSSRTRRSRSGGYRSRSHSRRSRSHGRGRSRSYGRRSRSRGYRSRSRSRSSRGYSRRSPYSRHVRRRGNSSGSSRNQSPSQKKLQSKSPSQSKTSPQPKTVNNKSKSPSPVRSLEVPAPPVITRYYGRRKNDESSSSELELSDSDEKSSDKNSAVPDKTNRSGFGNSGGRNKPPSGTSSGDKMTPQERLKRKMQLLLNKQYKADKRAEKVRLEKAEQERQDREEEMREISIKMRRRERQKRHQYYEYEERENERRERLSSISSQSLSSSPDSEYRRRRQYRHGSRERTRDRDKDRDRDRDRDRERDKDRDRERDHDRDRDREGERDRRRNRDRGKEKDDKDKSEVVQSRNRPLVDY